MRGTWLLAGAAVLASACAGLAQFAGKSRPLTAAPETPPSLRYIAGFELFSSVKAFGGLSGLVLSPEADKALVVTDKARWVRLGLEHRDERLVDVRIKEIKPILGEDSQPLPRRLGDIEAIVADAALRDIVISTEDSHRLLKVTLGEDDLRTPVTSLTEPPLFEGLPGNEGLEALARRREDGALIAIAEGSMPGERDHAGWILDGADEPKRFSVARIGFYKPTDLTQGPDGHFYLLERRFSLFAGFWVRLRRFEADAIVESARLTGTILGEIGPPEDIDNMEGIALRRGANGKLYLYMMSDNNFSALQRNLLLQFEIDEGAGAPPQ